MRQRNRRRHQVFILPAGIAKHHSLVAGAAGIHAHGNVAGLLVNARDYGAGVAIESVNGIVIADGAHRAAHHALEIYIRLGRDFCDDHHTGLDQRLAGHPTDRVHAQNRIEYGIGDLIGNLVRMPFRNRLGSKQNTVLRCCAQDLFSLESGFGL